MLREVLAKLERVSADQEREKQRAEENSTLAVQLRQRADDLYLGKPATAAGAGALQEGHLRSAGGSFEHEPAGPNVAGIR